MKTILFKPLRIIKKTGKITVASYMQWRKIKTADYSKFKLVIDQEYKSFPKDELVYNHKGENLFWEHYNPEEIPLINNLIFFDKDYDYPEMWKSDSGYFSAKGLDCDGVPFFSNFTKDNIYNSKIDMTHLDPLTVEMVDYWFGWFLYRLQNNELEFKNK